MQCLITLWWLINYLTKLKRNANKLQSFACFNFSYYWQLVYQLQLCHMWLLDQLFTMKSPLKDNFTMHGNPKKKNKNEVSIRIYRILQRTVKICCLFVLILLLLIQVRSLLFYIFWICTLLSALCFIFCLAFVSNLYEKVKNCLYHSFFIHAKVHIRKILWKSKQQIIPFLPSNTFLLFCMYDKYNFHFSEQHDMHTNITTLQGNNFMQFCDMLSWQ